MKGVFLVSDGYNIYKSVMRWNNQYEGESWKNGLKLCLHFIAETESFCYKTTNNLMNFSEGMVWIQISQNLV